nr:hypothetical protein [uncultured Pseudodesulfovibrio sp.]
MQAIMTNYGELIPQHTTDDLRKKDIIPTIFHDNGTPKSLPLEHQTTIITPVGDIPAELVTFHENGNINRIFPLNGRLSGYWSEVDEMGLARPIVLRTPAGSIATRIISISFYENETLRSITLCPDETVSIATRTNHYETRIGISFFPNGNVQSLEPARPFPVKTMAGKITAYDPDAVGVNGDKNSLVLDTMGNVIQTTTTLSRIKTIRSDGKTTSFTPEFRESYCSDTEQEVIPMVVTFCEQTVNISTNPDSPSVNIPKKNHLFFSEPYLPQLAQAMWTTSCSM